jgi:hypothetical protein
MSTVNDRLNALELEVTVLRGQVGDRGTANWIEAVAGSFRDEPEFDEVLRLGREARQRGATDNPNGGADL